MSRNESSFAEEGGGWDRAPNRSEAGGELATIRQLNSLIWPNQARFAAQPWGCSASTSCEIFMACCRVFPGWPLDMTALPALTEHINKTLWLFHKPRQVELRWRSVTNSGGGERKEQEAPGLVSEAWLNTQIVRVSAANPAEEHDTPPSPPKTNRGETGDAVQGQHFWGDGVGLGDGTGKEGQWGDVGFRARESCPRLPAPVDSVVSTTIPHKLTRWQPNKSRQSQTHTHTFNTLIHHGYL